MEQKYLYIDDNSLENAQGIVTGLQCREKLTIVFENPKGDWEKERDRILSNDFKEYNGLILDLNLEETPNDDKEISKYKGSTLAQEIRNLSKASQIKEIPIVLLSATLNLELFFDRTNENLFDLIISREKLDDNASYICLRNKLVSLSAGYEIISRIKKEENNLLELFRYDLEKENTRFLGETKSILENPSHTVANFIIKNLLEKNHNAISGILISEDILATRLGIDMANSRDWDKLLAIIDKHLYKGVFSEGWKRWWMSGIYGWWTVDLGIENSLRGSSASLRVSLLKEKLGLTELYALCKASKSKSENFWTNCIGSGAPIDTIDGLLISGQDNCYSWQDKNYISIEEALKPTGKQKWKKLSPSEDFKIEILQKQYPNERPAR